MDQLDFYQVHLYKNYYSSVIVEHTEFICMLHLKDLSINHALLHIFKK